MGDETDPATSTRAVPVMLGLVDTPETIEDFSAAAPQRLNRITGRTLSSVLSDHHWWFHSILSAVSNAQVHNVSAFLIGAPPSTEQAAREQVLRVLGLLAINPKLFALPDRKPARLMEAAYKFFVTGTETAAPFIKLLFADGVPLSQRLTFDADLAEASYVDPAARLISSQLATAKLPNASCWQLMRMFAEDTYQELFTETVGESIADASVRIVSRKAPFSGAIGNDGGQVGLVFSPTRPALFGESLFDEQRAGWDRYADTVYIGNRDVITQQLRRSVEGSGRVYTLYQVLPRLTPLEGNQGQQTWTQFILPIVDEDPESPSYIWRYGVRVFDRTLNSIPALDEERDELLPANDIARRCGAYAALAREWLYRTPLMWEGTFLLKGNPHVRAGKRLVDVDRKMEFYIVAVVHTIDNENGGLFTTTAQVTRGWELNSAV